MTEYEQNSAIKISTIDENTQNIEKKKIEQLEGFFKATPVIKDWHNSLIKQFLETKSDQTLQAEEIETNLGYIKEKNSVGEILDLDGWNTYAQSSQGGMTVPYEMRDFPNFYRESATDVNSWSVLTGDNIIGRVPIRFINEKGFELDRGYGMTTPAADVIDVLQKNASLDQLGNVFGKQELSVFSSNIALAFNGVSTKFSLMQLFLKSLLYASMNMIDNQISMNTMLTDAFPRLKQTKRTRFNSGLAKQGYCGFGEDAKQVEITWCTMGQLAAAKRGTLRYVDPNGATALDNILRNPEKWALVPVDGDVIAVNALSAAAISGNYVASHMKYPLFGCDYVNVYDNQWLMASIQAGTTSTDLTEIPLSLCNNIGGADNICFVLKNNMSTTPNGDMYVNFGAVPVLVHHCSVVPRLMLANEIAAWRDDCIDAPTLGLAELLKQYGSSEGLELALKYLPLFTYGYMQTPLMDVGTQDSILKLCCESTVVGDKGTALNRLNSCIIDPFGRGYDTVFQWYDPTATFLGWAKSYVYKLPAYTQMQSLAVACRVFQNLGGYMYNEWVPTSVYGYATFLPFLNDGDYFLRLLESLNRKTGAAFGALNAIAARAVGMPMAAVWQQDLIQYATLNLQFSEMMMKCYLQKEVYSAGRLTGNASSENSALQQMFGQVERQFNPAFNVSVTNLFALGLRLNSKKLVSEKLFEMPNDKKIAMRTIEMKVFKAIINSFDCSDLNLLGAIRVAFKHTDTYSGNYNPTTWFNDPWEESFTKWSGNWVRANLRTRTSTARDTIGVRLARGFSHDFNSRFGQLFSGGYSHLVFELVNPFHNHLPGTFDNSDDYYKALRVNSGSVHAVEVVETDDDPWGVMFAEDFSSVKKDFAQMADAFRD